MPIKKHLYPSNWKVISFRIRFIDQDGKCKWCHAEHGKPHPITGKKTVLTVAHLDHNESNMDRNNLVGLCQFCHLNYDRDNNLIRRLRKKQFVKSIFATGSVPSPS